MSDKKGRSFPTAAEVRLGQEIRLGQWRLHYKQDGFDGPEYQVRLVRDFVFEPDDSEKILLEVEDTFRTFREALRCLKDNHSMHPEPSEKVKRSRAVRRLAVLVRDAEVSAGELLLAASTLFSASQAMEVFGNVSSIVRQNENLSSEQANEDALTALLLP